MIDCVSILNSARSAARRWRSGILVALLVVSSAACDSTLFELSPLRELTPPPIYRVWWHNLETCVGIQGRFGEIRWFTGDQVTLNGEDVFGIWAAPNTIVLEQFYLTSAPAVKHEMLHHLTGGVMPHSHPAFTDCTAAASLAGGP